MIEIKVKKDGVWISVKTKDGEGAMLSLNNIVDAMNPKGITKPIFAKAIQEAGERLKPVTLYGYINVHVEPNTKMWSTDPDLADNMGSLLIRSNENIVDARISP